MRLIQALHTLAAAGLLRQQNIVDNVSSGILCIIQAQPAHHRILLTIPDHPLIAIDAAIALARHF